MYLRKLFEGILVLLKSYLKINFRDRKLEIVKNIILFYLCS